MGNTPSSEAHRIAFSEQHHPPPPPEPNSSNRLSKPRTRRRSITGQLRNKPDGTLINPRPRRSSTPGNSRRVPVSPLKLSFCDARPSSSHDIESPPISATVFTFEEAVVAVAGSRASGYWAPIAPAFNVDIQHLQDQQSQQHDLSQQPCPDNEFLTEDEERLEQKKSRFRKRSSILRPLSIHRSTRRRHEHYHSRRRNSIASERPSIDGLNTFDHDPEPYGGVARQYHDSSVSTSWQAQASSRASWNYNMSSYEAKRLLHIVDADHPVDHRLESLSTASESKASALSEMNWRGSFPAPEPGKMPMRTNSDLSLYAPMRRLSMLQIPGVATRRDSGNDNHVLGKGAPGRPDLPGSLPATPGLSRQASSESVQSCAVSTPPMPSPCPHFQRSYQDDPGQRVSTPCDSDYQAIGAFKLGTLRIMNGVASPMSSPERTKPKLHKDAIPAFDTARTEALTILTGANKKHGHGQVTDDPFTSSKAPDSHLHLLPSPVEQSMGPPSATSLGSFITSASSKPTSDIELPQIELPDDIFDGFALNFYLLDGANTTGETHPFAENAARSPGFLSKEILDVCLDPNAKSAAGHSKAKPKRKSTRSSRSIHSISRTDSGFISSLASESFRHKPLSKADSDYSSNMSLRSFKHVASKLMAPVAAVKAAARPTSGKTASPGHESFYIEELNLPGPTFDDDDAKFLLSIAATSVPQDSKDARPLPLLPRSSRSPQRKGPPPSICTAYTLPFHWDPLPPPPKDTPPITPGIAANQSSSHLGPLRRISRKRHSLAKGSRSPQQHSTATEDSLSAPPSATRPDSGHSTSSTAEISQKPNRLLRFFSIRTAANKGQTSTSSIYVEETEDVPLAPRNIQVHLHDQTGMYPATTRRLGLGAQISQETLKTIFSVGSLEARSVLEPQDGPCQTSIVIAEESQESSTQHESRAWNSRRYTARNFPLATSHPSSLPHRRVTHRRSWLPPRANESSVPEPSRDSPRDQLQHSLSIKCSYSRISRVPDAPSPLRTSIDASGVRQQQQPRAQFTHTISPPKQVERAQSTPAPMQTQMGHASQDEAKCGQDTVYARHSRNRSTGERSIQKGPYRVLHSYDSPAYRGAPI